MKYWLNWNASQNWHLQNKKNTDINKSVKIYQKIIFQTIFLPTTFFILLLNLIFISKFFGKYYIICCLKKIYSKSKLKLKYKNATSANVAKSVL